MCFSLPDVLEDGPIPPKYFLSRKACAGILNRAKRRGKTLPPILEYALERQANDYLTVAEPLDGMVIVGGEVAGTMPARSRSGGGLETDFEVTGGVQVMGVPPQVTHALRGEGWDGSEDGTGRGRPLAVCAGKAKKRKRAPGDPQAVRVYSVRVANRSSNGKGVGDIAYTLDRSGPCAVAYSVSIDNQSMGRGSAYVLDTQCRGTVLVSLDKRNNVGVGELGGGVANSLLANPGTGNRPMVLAKLGGKKVADLVLVVRYLTPLECERLQGIPDNYTLVPWRKGYAADGPRYKAVGNGMAVPCVAWVVKRLHEACAMRFRAV
ncbi:MAG: DNA cytosine methyltransferase [Planctomycetota bacterium]|nr:DNA cytosine methyltransferase [Planctomycetota bacterium]